MVYYDPKQGFCISEEGSKLLSSVDEDIGVIAVAGKYRTGKSYLLNKIILQTQGNSSGFGVGPTINPCTKGLWIWSKPIVTTFREKPLKVFVIDSEGTGALNEDANHDTRIFLLALLLSSYFIYNSMGTIDENALQNISLIVNLSNEIQVKERELAANIDEIPKYFPSFLWVVRDFSLKLVDSIGDEINSKEYLEKALELQKGSSDAVENKNKIRRMIKHFFTERDCVTLIRPIEDEKQLQNLNNLSEAELRDEFVTQLKTIQTRIRKRVKPKVLNGKTLNGSMLLELCKSYVNAINKGSVPCIENAWNYVLKYEAEKVIKSLVAEYNNFVKSLLPKSSEESLIGILQQLHEEIYPKIVGKFTAGVINDESKAYESSLHAAIDNAYKAILKNVEIKEQGKCEEFLKFQLDNIERKLRKGECDSMQDFNNALNVLNNEFAVKYPHFPQQTRTNLWRG